VIEGMTIAGYAIGAQHGYIYCRAEYPLAIHRLELALIQSRELGYSASTFWAATSASTSRSSKEQGPLFVAKETALMASIQVKRGQPWPRPPYLPCRASSANRATSTMFKSYAYVPRIVRLGADWFRGLAPKAVRARLSSP